MGGALCRARAYDVQTMIKGNCKLRVIVKQLLLYLGLYMYIILNVQKLAKKRAAYVPLVFMVPIARFPWFLRLLDSLDSLEFPSFRNLKCS